MTMRRQLSGRLRGDVQGAAARAAPAPAGARGGGVHAGPRAARTRGARKLLERGTERSETATPTMVMMMTAGVAALGGLDVVHELRESTLRSV